MIVEDDDDEDGKPERSREIEDFLASFTFDDILPRDAKKAAANRAGGGKRRSTSKEEMGMEAVGKRAYERGCVQEALVRYYPDLKAIHAHYSNQNGQSLDECLGAAAFTIDLAELKIFLHDTMLLDRSLTSHDLNYIFMRVNWSADAANETTADDSQGPLIGSAKYNNFDDSEEELNIAEFAHLLLRVSQVRLPYKRQAKNVAKHFIAMMEEHVLPNAKRDTLAFLRETITTDKSMRHLVFMYRKKLQALFRMYQVRVISPHLPTPPSFHGLRSPSPAACGVCGVPSRARTRALRGMTRMTARGATTCLCAHSPRPSGRAACRPRRSSR